MCRNQVKQGRLPPEASFPLFQFFTTLNGNPESPTTHVRASSLDGEWNRCPPGAGKCGEGARWVWIRETASIPHSQIWPGEGFTPGMDVGRTHALVSKTGHAGKRCRC